MALKFRLRGLAETFVDEIICPECKTEVTEDNEDTLCTEHTKVTLSGIVVVVCCENCSHVFIPDTQKHGIINTQRLQLAVERDSRNTGQPVYEGKHCVKNEVERLNASRDSKFH